MGVLPSRWCLAEPPQYAAWLLAALECVLSQLAEAGLDTTVTKEKLGRGLGFFRQGMFDHERLQTSSLFGHTSIQIYNPLS
jgi:hypothetical protein